MKTIKNLLIILMASLMFSCGDDFLEVEDKANLSKDNYPTTMAHLNDMLNGVYATQHSFGLFGHNMLGKNLYCWDHTTDLQWQGTPTWIQLAQNNTQINDGFLIETWESSWRGVQRANALLQGITTYRSLYASESDMAGLDALEGQAHFLRAWFYYYLVSIWGEDFIQNGDGGEKLGVPIVTKPAGNIDEAKTSRNTIAETWAFIVDDLRKSETLLNGVVWSAAPEKHKATEWAAKALLGKVYVYMEDWTNAKDALEDVIFNSNKQLVSFDVYKDMFNGKNEFNSESIFEVNMNVDKNTWGAWGDQSAGSGIGMVIGPTFVNAEGNASSSGWSNVFPHEKNLLRFGFKQEVPENAADPDYLAVSKANRDDKLVDPRLYVATLQPYLDSMKVDGVKRAIGRYPVETSMHAWSFRKYVNLDGSEYEVNVNNGSNFLWLRLADVYLLYAETLTKTGDNTLALEYINKVKRRAYGYPVDNPSPVDYTSLQDETNASDDILKNDPLKYERWAELFGEGNWWFDVRRWRLGPQEAGYYIKVRGGTIEWTDTDYAQPIPLNELLSNSNMIQNSGYPSR